MAMALVGAWIGITVCMWFAATGSFAAVRRSLQTPAAGLSEATRPLGPDQTRLVLRHLASEINREYFRAYGWAQIVLAAALLFLLLRQSPRDGVAVAAVGAMFVLVLILALYVTPEIVATGRALDFVPRQPPPPEWGRFRSLHGAYTVLDGGKLLAGIFLLVRCVMRG